MNEYKEDHPLHGRDAEWIAVRAEHTAGRVRLYDAPPRSRSVNLYWQSFSALVHEYKRLKALAEERSRSAPPTDWLTRAIEASGAPESSDWAGLLEAIDWLYAKENETHLEMRDWKRKAEDWQKSHDVAEQRRAAFESESNHMHRNMACLLSTAEAAEGGPTPCGYNWPDPDLGGLHALAVPYRVIRELAEERDRLKDRSNKASEACAGALNRADELDGEVRKLRERAEAAESKLKSTTGAFEHSMGETKEACQERKAAEARVAELEAIAETKLFNAQQQIEVRDDRIKELESAADRIAKERDMHAKTAALLGAGPLRPVSSPNPDPHLAELQAIRGLLERVVRNG